MKGSTILFTEMSPDLDWEDRFNRWYDGHQIKPRLSIPGFISAQRYKDAERECYLAVYELSNGKALESEEFQAIQAHPNPETRWMQANLMDVSVYHGTEFADLRRPETLEDAIDAPILYAVFFSVPDERVRDFDTWYAEEHVPTLLGCKDWLMCRRFLITEGDPQPWTHLALHYVADMSAFDSPEREAARSSPLREALSEEPWFQASTAVFVKHGERFAAAD